MFTHLEPIWQFLMISEVGLIALGLTSFLAATLLPLGSEPYLVAFLVAHPQQYLSALVMASLGNTAGGVTTWFLGRLGHRLANPALSLEKYPKLLKYLKKFGSKLLLLSWIPVFGDVMTGLAGWLKLPFWPCLIYLWIGKTLRYVFVIIGFFYFY